METRAQLASGRPSARPLCVLVAGAGVAGLEALLALRALAGSRVDVTLLAPESEFRYRQLSVAAPFERGTPVGFNIDEITRDLGAHHRRGELASVDVDAHIARTRAGTEISYDLLLLATGIGTIDSLPGALIFRGFDEAEPFRDILAGVEAGEISRLAFAVPKRAAWPLPAYELALMTAEHVRGSEDRPELMLVTSESRPLEVFGRRASDAVGDLLRLAGVEFVGGREVVAFECGRLALERREALAFDAVVALPEPAPLAIEGVPRDLTSGFIPTNSFGEVIGAPDLLAAGDATWFPVKQGGLAAQQADTAARTIAERAGASVLAEPFRPVLRGALMTSWGPRYLRRGPDGDSIAARSLLWWPPAKVAGRYLAPYLAQLSGDPSQAIASFRDLDPPPTDDPTVISTGHEDAVALALASAQADADEREFGRAVRWLKIAEDLDLKLPAGFEAKRVAWRSLAGGASRDR